MYGKPSLFRMRIALTFVLIYLVTWQSMTPPRIMAQQVSFKQKMMQTAACAGGGVGAVKIGEKLGQLQGSMLHLSPAATNVLIRKYQLGMAMSLCKGGEALVGTTFAKLSEKDKKQRQTEIDAAVADTAPGTKTFVLPDHPELTERLTTSEIATDGNKECRTVEDNLADKDQNDTALVKWCRKPPSTNWEVAT